MVGDEIEIMVTRIERDTVRIRISAPREVPIFRGELYREIKRATGDAPIAPLISSREREATGSAESQTERPI